MAGFCNGSPMLSLSILRNLNAAYVAARRPDCVVSDFPEYATEVSGLSAQQTAQIRDLARRVFASLSSHPAARAVVILGHADVALRVSPPQRAAFEMDVSVKRAQSGKKLFEAELVRSAGARSVLYMVRCEAFGMGSADRVVLHPQNEADMRRNRRVEFFILTQNVGSPSCNCSE
jgi:outer membrane protein OmpA-like peptidoglycan-associated protein